MPNWFGPTGDCGCCADCVFKTDLTACQCLDGDYGNYDTIQRVDVVISGSATCYELDPVIPPLGTCNNETFTGADWTGTYSVNCTDGNDSAGWSVAHLACTYTFGGTDYEVWVIEGMGISFSVNNEFYAVDVSFNSSQVIATAGQSNPCATITAGDCTIPGSESASSNYTRQYRQTQENDDDLYTNCSGITQRRGCITTVPYDSAIGPSGPGGNAGCSYPPPTTTSVTIVNV